MVILNMMIKKGCPLISHKQIISIRNLVEQEEKENIFIEERTDYKYEMRSVFRSQGFIRSLSKCIQFAPYTFKEIPISHYKNYVRNKPKSVRDLRFDDSY